MMAGSLYVVHLNYRSQRVLTHRFIYYNALDDKQTPLLYSSAKCKGTWDIFQYFDKYTTNFHFSKDFDHCWLTEE